MLVIHTKCFTVKFDISSTVGEPDRNIFNYQNQFRKLNTVN